MHVLPRLIPFCLIAGLALAGCAHQPTTSRSAGSGTARTTSATASETHTVHRESENTTRKSSAETDAALPQSTGIPACDDYLSSYMACHRAAQIFAPDQLPARYQAMRTSLLRDSQNPDIRPQLAARCNSLATQLRQALHGKACQTEPASSASAP